MEASTQYDPPQPPAQQVINVGQLDSCISDTLNLSEISGEAAVTIGKEAAAKGQSSIACFMISDVFNQLY